MINITDFRQIVTNGLNEYLQIPVTYANLNVQMPDFPYCAYIITSLSNSNKGTWGVYDDGIDRQPVTQTWNIAVNSNNLEEAYEHILKAKDWFDLIGVNYLRDRDIIVQSVGEILNEDIAIMHEEQTLPTTEYIYHNSFNVVFYITNEIDENNRGVEVIEMIEMSSSEGTINVEKEKN